MLIAMVVGLALMGTPAPPPRVDGGPLQVFPVVRCKLEYKPEARTAYFAAKVFYRFVSDAHGSVVTVEEKDSGSSAPPFRPVFESLRKCLKTWLLKPGTEYEAELRWGSNGQEPTWRICRTTGGCIAVSDRQ